jgi:hypothetical protein
MRGINGNYADTHSSHSAITTAEAPMIQFQGAGANNPAPISTRLKATNNRFNFMLKS